MQVEWREIMDLLVDPVSHAPLDFDETEQQLRGPDGQTYGFLDSQPVLLSKSGREKGWRFPAIEPSVHRSIRSGRGIARRALMAGRRLLRPMHDRSEMISRIQQLVSATEDRSILLIVGGGSVGEGADALADIPGARIVSFDVYASPDTTFVADAHQIPLADRSVQAVWIQAVLEHVTQPSVVVEEIGRVLAIGGMVYAETPFLQPVHEGAYDFTRFTQSGHRLLFSEFDEVRSEPLGGPGSLAALAVRGLAGGIFHSHRAARIAYAFAAWLAHLDRVVPATWRSDFGTGMSFLGTRRAAPSATFNAQSEYKGAQ